MWPSQWWLLWKGGFVLLGRSRSCWLWIQHSAFSVPMAQGRTSPSGTGTLGNFGPLPIKLLTFYWGPLSLQEEEPKPAVWGKIFGLFWGFLSCAWEAIKSFFSQFWGGIWFLVCVPPVLCCLFSSQPALRSSRDPPTSLFHDNISFQAPAFAFWPEEILYLFHLLSLLSVLSHGEMIEVVLCWLKAPRFPAWIQVYTWVSIKKISLCLNRKGIHRALLMGWSQSCWQRESQILDSFQTVGIDFQLPRTSQQEWSMDKCEQRALHAGHRFSQAALLFKYFL